MQIFDKKWLRFLTGALLVIIILSLTFMLLPKWIETYGATQGEVNDTYPGDEILPSPVIQWTHAITVKAPVEKTWPWIAQIGQSRGGFYSYTFIENLISRDNSFINAERILPEFQEPQPGEEIIRDMLPVKEVTSGKYLLTATEDFFGLGWTWLWYLKPLDAANTRLIIRMKIQTSSESLNPLASAFLNAGGFVMENCMLRGIQDRAEGRSSTSPNEPLEIIAWVGMLFVGMASIWMVLKKKKWLLPLIMGIFSVVGLLIFTFVQPPIFWRLAGVILLGGWLVFIVRGNDHPGTNEQM
jgi:hypothetical protein